MTCSKFLLAPNQYDIWLDQAFYADSPLYNIGGYIRINGELDVSLMSQALSQLIDESDALRINFKEDKSSEKGKIFQFVSEKFSYDLECIDFSTAKNPEMSAQQWVADCFKIPFSLNGTSSCWKISLLKINARSYFLMTKYHHLIADGWATKVVFSRLAELYNALLETRAPRNKPKYSYSDYIAQEQSYLASQRYQRDEAYWLKILPKLPSPLILPTHAVESMQTLPKANIHRFFLPREFYNRMEQFSVKHKVTNYHLFLCAVALYFARIFQREDIFIGLPGLNRNGARYKDVIGMYVSLSPLSLNVNLNHSIQSLLKLCGKTLRDNYRHQRFPLGKIYQRLGLVQNKRNSIFDIVISYERQEHSMLFGGNPVSAHQQFSGVARYPLGVTICEFNKDNDVEIVLEGAENSFASQKLKRLGQSLSFILEQMITYPELLLKNIDLLSGYERKILFGDFNSIKEVTHFPGDVVSLFQQQVNENPKSTVLEMSGKSMTFQELDEQSNQLAHFLISLGVKNGQIIAICLPRCIEMIVAMVAILKTGSAYLPISPDTPVARIDSMLKQSQAMALITIGNYRKRFFSLHSNLVLLDENLEELVHFSNLPVDVVLKENDLAYVIFTSGSSGKPKGVLLEHGALSRRLISLAKLFMIQKGDRVGQTIQFNFDPSIIEIFLPLIQGGCLVLAPEPCNTPEEITKFVVQNRINMLALVPSSLRAILHGLTNVSITELKTVCCGGEVLPTEMAKQFINQTGARLFNVYGTTETVILATAWECSEMDTNPLPLGHPIEDTRVYILDGHNQLLPQGVIGEIAIGGIVARGYLQSTPVLLESPTEEKFLNDAFIENQNARYYKTGDRGYIGFDGQLYFSGRIDRQVKISGYRIEPGEIESILERDPRVRLAAVTMLEEQGNKGLYAFVEYENTQKEKFLIDLSELLRKLLPGYMQPKAIVPMIKIPELSNGKIDYSALHYREDLSETLYFEKEHKLPRSQLETHLMQCWEEVLGTNELGIRDNFFEFGADSLSAIKLIKKIESISGHHCPLSFLLEHPTIEQQAEVLGRAQPSIAVPLLTTLSEYDNTLPFYLAASGHGDAIRFANLAEALGGVCSLHMLQPSGASVENKSIEELAMSYAELILIRDDVPGYIGGFSIGGITALETARILSEQGKPPIGVILLDTVYPHGLLKSPVLYSFLRFIAKFPILNQIPINGRRLETMLADPGIRTQLRALRDYHLKLYGGEVALFVSSGLWGKCWCFPRWEKVLGSGLRRYSISGMHGGIFQTPHLATLTNAIKNYFKVRS